MIRAVSIRDISYYTTPPSPKSFFFGMGSWGWLGVAGGPIPPILPPKFFPVFLRGPLGCVGLHPTFPLQRFLGALLQGHQTPPPGVFG